jgi:hypothetical protein
MRAVGYSYPTIDKMLGRRSGAMQQRLEIAGHGSKDHAKSFRAPDYLVAERDALAAARNRRTLTQDFCGDRRCTARQGNNDAAGAACSFVWPRWAYRGLTGKSANASRIGI